MQDTSREGDEQMQEIQRDPYTALDNLLKAVGKLSLSYIMDRPPLMQAVNQGHEVIDEAVRGGHYVPQ